MTLNQIRQNLTKIINRIYGRDMLDEETINELEEVESALIEKCKAETKFNMSVFSIMPVVSVEDLEKGVNTQFGTDLDLRNLLFDNNYINDCYKEFDYSVPEVYMNLSWQDEERIQQINLVKTFLQDVLPEYTKVIIDVSW